MPGTADWAPVPHSAVRAGKPTHGNSRVCGGRTSRSHRDGNAWTRRIPTTVLWIGHRTSPSALSDSGPGGPAPGTARRRLYGPRACLSHWPGSGAGRFRTVHGLPCWSGAKSRRKLWRVAPARPRPARTSRAGRLAFCPAGAANGSVPKKPASGSFSWHQPEIRPTSKHVVVSGNPADEIAEIAARHGVGLIVMGLSGEGASESRPGSVAYRVLTMTSVPVLALPPAQKAEPKHAAKRAIGCPRSD